jgi:hypothetical protein
MSASLAVGAVVPNDPLDALTAQDRDTLARAVAVSFGTRVGELATAVDRRWWRILLTDEFDAWLIDWPPGTGVERHDHTGSEASLHLIRGELTELTFEPGRTRTTSLRPRQVHHVAAATSHAIHNRTIRPATSVHVYSPPLRSMGIYGTDGVPDVRPVDSDPTIWTTSLP